MAADNNNEEARQYVLRSAQENDVKFIRLWFTDILGNLKGFAITVAELEGAMEKGMSFDGSTVAGFARRDESDMVAMPDPTTFSILPWRPRQNAVARMFCDILRPTGEPFEGDPRHVLKIALGRAADLGFEFQVGPELEHFYLKSADDPTPLDVGGYFDLTTPLDTASDLRRETVLSLEEMGIPVEYSHHEVANSQHEIDLRHTDALTMADTVMTYRQVVKEVAMSRGVYATFMPKPFEKLTGNGCHAHVSLWNGNVNKFLDKSDRYGLNKMAYNFLGGIIKNAQSLSAFFNPTINSYRRINAPATKSGASWSPSSISYSGNNRTHMIRIPDPGRFELRLMDGSANPYLLQASIAAAGLYGIDNKSDPGELLTCNMYTDYENYPNLERLPDDLYESLEKLNENKIVKEAFGEEVVNSYLKLKKKELNDFETENVFDKEGSITDWEKNNTLDC